MSALLDPWRSGLGAEAFAVAVLVGMAAGALGALVMLRGLAFVGEALSHTMVLGGVVAILVGAPVALGAAASAGLTAVAAPGATRDARVSTDTAMGVLLPGFFGAGVLLATAGGGVSARLEGLLFGSALGAGDLDLGLAAVAVVAVSAVFAAAGPALALATFDREAARAAGVRVAALDAVVMGLVVLVAVVAFRAVGALLLTAVLLGPPVAARLHARSFGALVAGSAGAGGLCALTGMYASWYLDVGTGPAVALAVVGAFALSVLGGRGRGAATVAAAAVLLAGCADVGDGRTADGRVRVVATTMVVADFAREVAGPRADVIGLLGPGAEPHGFEPTPHDADAVARARVLVRSGGTVDAWLGDLVDDAGSEARVVTAARGLIRDGDPHVWHDPRAARTMVRRIAAGLAAADPAGRAGYARRAARLERRIARMARTIHRTVAPVPRMRRVLVTTHDAFRAFARAYGVTVAGTVLPKGATEREPSARRVRELIELLRRDHIRTVFTEHGLAARLETRIAHAAAATVSTSLYADGLATAGPQSTYVGA